ncbi:MAG: hypothetical protein ACP5LN_07550 [Thermoproteota archaeon]
MQIDVIKNKQLVDSAGGAIDQIGRVYIIGQSKPDSKKFENSYEIFYAQGAAMVIRRAILKRIGLLDEDYFTLSIMKKLIYAGGLGLMV